MDRNREFLRTNPKKQTLMTIVTNLMTNSCQFAGDNSIGKHNELRNHKAAKSINQSHNTNPNLSNYPSYLGVHILQVLRELLLFHILKNYWSNSTCKYSLSRLLNFFVKVRAKYYSNGWQRTMCCAWRTGYKSGRSTVWNAVSFWASSALYRRWHRVVQFVDNAVWSRFECFFIPPWQGKTVPGKIAGAAFS